LEERPRRPGYFCSSYLKRYWRYMRALSSTSASVTWLRPREATRSSMRLRIKRRMRKGLRLMRRSASGSQVICCWSGNVHLFRRVLRACILPQQVGQVVIRSALTTAGSKAGGRRLQPSCRSGGAVLLQAHRGAQSWPDTKTPIYANVLGAALIGLSLAVWFMANHPATETSWAPSRRP
jgi:hypothetical protein